MDTYCCDEPGCKKRYKSKINLKRHKDALHGSTKKFQCHYCQKVLSSKQNLQEHLMTHSKEIPFICKELGCGKRFRHASQYSAHKRIHNNIKLIQVTGEDINIDLVTSILTKNEEKVRKYRIDGGFGAKNLLPKISSPQEFKLPSL
jgi:RNase P subunit RPR2